MKLDDETMWSIEDGPIPDISLHANKLSDDILDLASDGWFTPEVERITLPSALASGEIERLSPINCDN